MGTNSRGKINNAENIATSSESDTVDSIDNDSTKENVKIHKQNARSSSPKRHKGILIRFCRVRNRTNFARAQILLCNISDRPLRYKLKGEQNVDIAALPSGKGYICAHGSACLMLTWHTAEGSYARRAETKLVLYTQFFDMKDAHRDIYMATKLVATVLSKVECDPDKPPMQQLILDAENNEGTSPIDTPSINDADTLIISMPTKANRRQDGAAATVVGRLIEWMHAQSRETLCMLIICAVIAYSIGVASSRVN